MAIRRGKAMLLISGALVAGALVWAFRPQPIAVDLSQVKRGDLRVTIDEEGMTRVRDRYVVAAPVAGRLQRIALRPGDSVSAGTTVVAAFLPATPAPLDPRTRAETLSRLKAAQAAREQARIALDRARDEAAFNRSELGRYREIAKFGGTTDERMAAVELQARTSDTQLQASEAALQRANHEVEAIGAVLRQFEDTAATRGGQTAMTLRSPVSGVVLRVHQESETPLAAGTPLVEIGNPGRLEVVVDLLSTDAVKVKPGLPALITGWGGDATLHARVRLVEPSGFTKVSALGVEEQRVNVVLDFQNLEHIAGMLGDGYRVDVNVIVSECRGVLKVPTSALFRMGDQWRVFAARDGRASTVEVQLGQRNAVEAEVVSGLSEDDAVIVHPGDTIADGVAVIQREQP